MNVPPYPADPHPAKPRPNPQRCFTRARAGTTLVKLESGTHFGKIAIAV
jgi:hypothetical protein